MEGGHYLSFRGEPETGSICDIVVRDQVTLQGALHRFDLEVVYFEHFCFKFWRFSDIS